MLQCKQAADNLGGVKHGPVSMSTSKLVGVVSAVTVGSEAEADLGSFNIIRLTSRDIRELMLTCEAMHLDKTYKQVLNTIIVVYRPVTRGLHISFEITNPINCIATNTGLHATVYPTFQFVLWIKHCVPMWHKYWQRSHDARSGVR